MDLRLLDILVCPVSHAPLHLASRAELAAINAAIGKGEVRTVGGNVQAKTLAAALLTPDGATAYRVEDDIPVLLAEEALATTGLEAA